MVPETRTPITDSTKMKKPKAQASVPAERLVLTKRRRVIPSMKPFMPPEYCTKVRRAPIMMLTITMRVRSPSWNKSGSASTAWTSPARGFQPLRMVHPNQMPVMRAR
jgi:hypothetical protein